MVRENSLCRRVMCSDGEDIRYIIGYWLERLKNTHTLDIQLSGSKIEIQYLPEYRLHGQFLHVSESDTLPKGGDLAMRQTQFPMVSNGIRNKVHKLRLPHG